MLKLQGIGKTFGATEALRSVDISIKPGEFVGVIGSSGAGKSTLLRVINRLLEPSVGTITYDGIHVSTLRGKDLREWHRRCAMIFQQFNLMGRLDVLTNVLMGRLAHMPAWRALLKFWSNTDRAIALSALDQFEIADLATQRADHLSGGQQQRVAICRALVQEPDLILADEPIASLDPRSAQLVMQALRKIHQEFGLTVICNLHDLDVARSYCGRLIGLNRGEVVFDGAPEKLSETVGRKLYEKDETPTREPA